MDDEFVNASSEFDYKWSEEIREAAGFTMIPNLLIENVDNLEITPSEFMVIVAIESHRWSHENLPYPGKKRLALWLGLTPRTITRIISALVEKGLIERIPQQGTANRYSMEPLKEALEYFIIPDDDEDGSDINDTPPRQNEPIEGEVIDTGGRTPLTSKKDENNQIIQADINKHVPHDINFDSDEPINLDDIEF